MTKIVILLSVILVSCASAKWKSSFLNSRLSKLQEKYNVKNEYEAHINAGEFVNKAFKELNRRDIKKNVKSWERVYALMPDSVYQGNEHTDSFYFNQNKVSYIIKMKIERKHIHIIQKIF